MDFITWLQENNIQYSLTKNSGSFVFGLNNITVSDGILVIEEPCMLGRTPSNAVNLFIISYDGFVFQKNGKNLIIMADKFEAKNIPEAI